MSHGGGGEVKAGSSHVKDGIIDLFAGTLGGMANVYAGQPLDTVKVKVQTFPHLYTSWTQCLKETYRLDGVVRGLYAGTIPALAANIAENAVLFCAYGYCQKMVGMLCGHSDVKQMNPVENALSGSCAAVFAALVLCPTELVKCQLQAARETHPNSRITSMSVIREIVADKGVKGLFTGMTATMCREVPGYFCFFGSYELSRYLLTPEGKTKDEIGVMRTAVCGGIGGMALWTSIYPVDVVKSRMQVAGEGSFLPMLLKIARTEGITALYKGLTPTIIRSALASGSLFIAYEESKKIMHDFL